MTWTLLEIWSNLYSSALIILIAGVLTALLIERIILKIVYPLILKTKTPFGDLIIHALG